MLIYFAADHAGFESKNELMRFVRDELHHEVLDCGATVLNAQDDYPELIAAAARKLSHDALAGLESRAIIGGGSGQGEAMAANRFKGVRCAVYYGKAQQEQIDTTGSRLDMLSSVRQHNDANALSLAFRFISLNEAKEAVREFLSISFPNDERHVRRIKQLDLGVDQAA